MMSENPVNPNVEEGSRAAREPVSGAAPAETASADGPGGLGDAMAGAGAAVVGGTPTEADVAGAAPFPLVSLPLAELEDLRARAVKAEEHWDRYVRTMADLDNVRKRSARERQEALRLANEGLLSRLLPVLDNFEMALAATQNAGETNLEALRTGVTMIGTQLKGALNEAGLEEIDATGQPFDPNVHEAVSQQETDAVEEGRVVLQLRKGYKYRERLLRPASVVVARAPAPPSAG